MHFLMHSAPHWVCSDHKWMQTIARMQKSDLMHWWICECAGSAHSCSVSKYRRLIIQHSNYSRNKVTTWLHSEIPYFIMSLREWGKTDVEEKYLISGLMVVITRWWAPSIFSMNYTRIMRYKRYNLQKRLQMRTVFEKKVKNDYAASVIYRQIHNLYSKGWGF